jgi:3-deoxy-D-manno-oct-2-ulosonic acid (Kdo) hydroxylase
MNPQTSSIDLLRRYDDVAWPADAGTSDAPTRQVEPVLEGGGVLWFPRLAFALAPDETRFLDPRFADPKAKNISLRGAAAELRGAAGTDEEREGLRRMIQRYRIQASALVDRLFPHYRGHLTPANTSYRPVAIEGRPTSWRKDDTRLHVDAFPSNPSHGLRLLRVFNNLNPQGQPRKWRVGEPFEVFASRHVPRIPRPLPGSAWLLAQLHITKSRRSEYDHLMLQLHDRAKADLDWQQTAPQQHVDFPPGSTWVVFSDQVLHAAMGGQYMMEQTFTLHTKDLLSPDSSPLHVLQRLTGRPLLA